MVQRLCVLILVLSLVLAACSGPEPQAISSPVTPADTPSQPTKTPLPTEAPKPQQTENPAPQATPTSPQAACSSAGIEILAAMVLDVEHQGRQLTLVDLTNGLPSCGFHPVSLDRNFQMALSPHGKRLAVITSKRDDFYDSRLLFVDLATQQVFSTSIVINNWISDMAFSPDSSRFALAYPELQSGPQKPEDTRYTLLVADFASQAKPVETTLPFGPRLLRFTQDGSAIVAYGTQDGMLKDGYPTASTALLDASDLSVLWKQDLLGVKHGYAQSEEMIGDTPLMDMLEPAFVYAAKKNTLYIAHADQEKLSQVDFSGRKVTTLDIQPKMSWIERWLSLFADPAMAKALKGTRKQAVLTPDGSRMILATTYDDVEKDQDGNFSSTHKSLGMQILDLETGAELDRIETAADQIYISPDGRSVFLATWERGDQANRAEVISTKDWTVRASFDGGWFLPTMSVIGKPHMLLLKDAHGDTQITLLDWDTLEPVGSWEAEDYPFLASAP